VQGAIPLAPRRGRAALLAGSASPGCVASIVWSAGVLALAAIAVATRYWGSFTAPS
jgi:hypothetical protein